MTSCFINLLAADHDSGYDSIGTALKAIVRVVFRLSNKSPSKCHSSCLIASCNISTRKTNRQTKVAPLAACMRIKGSQHVPFERQAVVLIHSLFSTNTPSDSSHHISFLNPTTRGLDIPVATLHRSYADHHKWARPTLPFDIGRRLGPCSATKTLEARSRQIDP